MKTDGSDKKQMTKTDTIGSYLQKHQDQFAKALPEQFGVNRFIRVFLTAIRMNPKLGQCDMKSLLGAMMLSAQLGLEPNTPLGLAYIIPYGNQATFQIGYKGLVELAQRSGVYRRLIARPVDEADEFSYEYGLDETLKHVPTNKPTGKKLYYYAVYELDNGGKSFTVWSYDKIVQHAKKYSKSYEKSDSAWQSAFDQMAMKTVLVDLLRYAPKSVEVARVVSADERTHIFDVDDPDAEIETIEGDIKPQTETEKTA
jgi:recombination protein RecT